MPPARCRDQLGVWGVMVFSEAEGIQGKGVTRAARLCRLNSAMRQAPGEVTTNRGPTYPTIAVALPGGCEDIDQ